MKPIKSTIECEQEEKRKIVCDEIIHRAANLMVGEVEASVEMMLDRMFTFAAAQSYQRNGKTATVKIMREMARNIENGALDLLKLNEGSAKH